MKFRLAKRESFWIKSRMGRPQITSGIKGKPSGKGEGLRNPLHAVAMFSAFAEFCGTAVLLKLDATLQPVFLWFFMGFPTLLLVLFFLTLNFNSTVFYAPVDFEDDDSYRRSQRIPTPDPVSQPKRTRSKSEAPDDSATRPRRKVTPSPNPE